jgi:hypothetical protein
MKDILPNINNTSRRIDLEELYKAKSEEEIFENLADKGKAIKTITPVSQGYRITIKKK